jgi:uncharacterized protein (UPF0332 family)
MSDYEALFSYRIEQAESTLAEAVKMLASDFSPRSIVNRAYYSMFYFVLALFLKSGLKVTTSKHVGIISYFDKEFINTRKIDKKFSAMLHSAFDNRMELDYKDFAQYTTDDARKHVAAAQEFAAEIIRHIKTIG